MMMKHLFFALSALALILLIGIGVSSTYAENVRDPGKIRVVATTSHIADLLENLNPGHLEVTSLMGPGVDPHLFKPAASDIARLSSADIVFYNGLHLEGQMGELLETMGRRKPVLGLASHLRDVSFLEGQATGTVYDPHIWMDVSLWRKCAAAAADLLTERDPDRAAQYAANLAAYDAELQNLDLYVRRSIASIPEARRVLVTAHDAFGYFGQAYNVEVVGIQGLSTESEAGLKHMRDMSLMIAARRVPAIFSETSVSVRNIEALQAQTLHNGFEVGLGKTLFSDSLGAEGSEESTYVGMMVYNTQSIVSGLGGIVTAYRGHQTVASAE